MVDTADSKPAFCWFKSDRGYTPRYVRNSPDDGMVDVTDLGSVFWQFKSASGQATLYLILPYGPLGEMVDTVALKATLHEVSVRVR